MKTFTQYLTEAKKTYSFKIKVAGDLPEGFKENLEGVMDKYGLIKMTGPKRTPISEIVADFPHVKNQSVNIFEVEVQYPTTASVLQDYIANIMRVSGRDLIVRDPQEPVDLVYNKEGQYGPILEKDYEEDKEAQKTVGSARTMSLLKELETERKDRVVKEQPVDKEHKHMDIEEKTSKSPVGSSTVKKFDPRKGMPK